MINPEEIELLIKGYKEAQPELTKAMNEIMKQFALTESDHYQGALPLAGILYAQYEKMKPFLNESDVDIIALYKDFRIFLRTLSAMAVQLAKWAGMAEDDIKKAVSGSEDGFIDSLGVDL